MYQNDRSNLNCLCHFHTFIRFIIMLENPAAKAVTNYIVNFYRLCHCHCLLVLSSIRIKQIIFTARVAEWLRSPRENDCL